MGPLAAAAHPERSAVSQSAQLLLAMLQKVESPSRKAESVPKYEERTSEFDKTLTSGGANPDKVQYQHLHSCI